jgi:glycerol-3-phosphate acyltransferase PlsY
MLAVVFGYFAGSVPFAFLFARSVGIDVRVAGSGNLRRLRAGTERRIGAGPLR